MKARKGLIALLSEGRLIGKQGEETGQSRDGVVAPIDQSQIQADIEIVDANEADAMRRAPFLAFVDKSDAHAGGHQRQHFRLVDRFVHHIDRHPRLEQAAMQFVVIDRAFASVKRNDGLIDQLANVDRRPSGKRRVLRHRQKHGVARDRADGEKRIRRRIVEEARIDPAIMDAFELLQSAQAVQDQANAGITVPEGHDRRRDDAVPGRDLDEAELENARFAPRHGLRFADRMAKVGQDLAAMREKGPAGDGKLHPTRQPVEQGHPEFGLQQLDLPAERRLGDADTLGGAAEMLLLGHGDEISDLSQIHGDRYQFAIVSGKQKYWTLRERDPIPVGKPRPDRGFPTLPVTAKGLPMHAFSPYLALEHRTRQHPDDALIVLPKAARLAYAPDGLTFSYGEMFAAVSRLKAMFAAAGYGAGHRVALLLENRPEFFAYWLALNGLGVSIVPVNPDLRPGELHYQLSLSETGLLVALSKDAATLEGLDVDGLAVIEAGDPPPPARNPASRQHGLADDECALLFTSGSTGKPKGCMLSNAYFMTLADWYVTQGGIAAIRERSEVALTPLPMFHMNALGCTALGMIVCGGAFVPLDRFHASRWWETVSQSSATIVHCLGVIPAILLRLPPSPFDRDHTVRFSFGPGVDAQHKIEFEARYRIPIVEAWAMTETGGRATTTTARDDYTPGLRCIGRPRAGMDHRIVDDAGRPVPLGTPGELIVRAAGADPRQGFFSGYLKDEVATEEAWAGGWFHTGDIVHEDDRGLLYFFDRKKSIVRRSGENIAVLEVEAALSASAAVKAVAVTPVADALRGEEVFAFIVRAETAGGDAPESLAEDLVREAAERLAYHKLPGYIVFVDALPLGSTQKLQRGEIKAMAAGRIERGNAFDLRALKAALRRKPVSAS